MTFICTCAPFNRELAYLCEVINVLNKLLYFSLSLSENPEFILYAERTSIWRYFLNDGTKEQLPIEGLQLATAVDYDLDHNCYYYAEVTYDEIHVSRCTDPTVLSWRRMISPDGNQYS